MRARRPALAALLLFGACRDSVPLYAGVDQPVRVEDGFFLDGDLTETDQGPTVTSIESANAIALRGQIGRTLTGRVRSDADAVGLRFATLGTGWWISQIGDIAALYPEERDFSLGYDLGAGIPPGLHALRVAAIDDAGRRGPELDLDLCVLDDAMPANLNPCDPSLPPPAAVVAVEWNRPVDLDLVVESPTGKLVRWKSPTTAEPVDGVVPDDALDDPSLGRLDRDSNAGCIRDGRNTEAVVWQEAPAAGTWSVYVDLFDGCGEPDVTWSVAVYVSREQDDGTMRLEEIERRGGDLVTRIDAYGGAEPPLYVLSVDLP